MLSILNMKKFLPIIILLLSSTVYGDEYKIQACMFLDDIWHSKNKTLSAICNQTISLYTWEGLENIEGCNLDQVRLTQQPEAYFNVAHLLSTFVNFERKSPRTYFFTLSEEARLLVEDVSLNPCHRYIQYGMSAAELKEIFYCTFQTLGTKQYELCGVSFPEEWRIEI